MIGALHTLFEKKTIHGLGILLCAWLLDVARPSVAQANEVLVTATVTNGRYVNNTRQASYCQQFGAGAGCSSKWTFDLPLTYTKMIDVGGADVRNRVYLNLPAPRSFTLVNQTNRETASMALTFADVSQRVSYQTQEAIGMRVSGCLNNYPNGGAPGRYSQHLWTFIGGACYSTQSGNGELQDSEVTRLGVSVNPSFPDPSQLSSGIWEGTINYPVGPGQDFDFGNTTSTSTNNIIIRVRITISHDISVDFPAAGSTIALTPEGGWQRIINNVRVPSRLYHDSPLRLSAAGALAVYLACQYPGRSSRCYMRNHFGNHQAPVEVALTLPGTFTHNGQPVTRLPLSDGRENWKRITPASSTTNQPGMLHFTVEGDGLNQMLGNRGSHYSGWITIIYDANP